MSKENKTSDKQQNGNDFIADVGRSSWVINPKKWDLFQWCYAYFLWALIWCGLINLIVLVFS